MVGGILGRGLTLFDPPIELLADVNVINVQDGQILVYQASTNQWVNKSLIAGSGVSITQNSTQIIIGTQTIVTGDLVAEDGTTLLTAEDGTTQLVTET